MNTFKDDLTDAGAVDLDETGAEKIDDAALDHAVGGHGYLYEPLSRHSGPVENESGDDSTTTGTADKLRG
ncbi:MAG: hypothetical protein AAF526_05060 [Pseudomonadota bacterium]